MKPLQNKSNIEQAAVLVKANIFDIAQKVGALQEEINKLCAQVRQNLDELKLLESGTIAGTDDNSKR